MNKFFHIPVLKKELIFFLQPKKNGIYVDCTFGAGGHAKEVLKILQNGKLFVFDDDKNIFNHFKKETEICFLKLSQKNNNKFTFFQTNFSQLKVFLSEKNISQIDGIYYDLGPGTFHFNDKKRGFSYRFDSPLDMRYNQKQEVTAKFIINNYSLTELVSLFRDFSEDPFAFPIAKEIIRQRKVQLFTTTFELVELICRVKNRYLKKKLKKHPAKQIFQALRIAVNKELTLLKESLEQAFRMLAINGRLLVITYHSLEDRLVKQLFKKIIQKNNCSFTQHKIFQIVNKKVIVPSQEEQKVNNSSRSAKMRVLWRIN